MVRTSLNLILLLALMAVVALTFVLPRDFTHRNEQFLPDMVISVPYNAQSENPNFPDGKTLRRPVAGTIARGFELLPYKATHEDAIRAGEELRNPFKNDSTSDERGAVVFFTFCQPCHGLGGLGDGTVPQRGFPPPPSLLAENARKLKDGQMFHIVTFGRGNMPSLAAQVARDDRWHAINHIRELQATQSTTAVK